MIRQRLAAKLAFIATIGLLILVQSWQAAAEDSKIDNRAEALFSQALLLMKSGHCEEAIRVFMESQQQDPAAATLANIATCHERLGKIATAFVTYQAAAPTAVFEQDYQLQQRIDRVLAELGPRLTRLRITPIGTSDQPIIRVNGHRVEDLESPILLDPGENIIEATAPGRQSWRKTLSAVSEGTLIVVEVPELSSAVTQAPPSTVSRPQRVAAARRGVVSGTIDLKPFAIIATGLGAAGIAVGSVLGLSARSRQTASNQYCDGHFCTAAGSKLRNDAADRAELATWSTGIGLVSAAAATALWVAAAKRDEQRARTLWLPEIRLGHSEATIGLGGWL